MIYKKKTKPKEKTVLKVVIKKIEKPKLSFVKRVSCFLKQLKQDFKVFADNIPLELGVSKKLYAIYCDVPHRVINTALYQHTKSRHYLMNLSNKTERFSLCGEPSSDIDPNAKKLAKESLKKQMREVKQNARIRIKERSDNKRKQNTIRT